MDEIVKPMLPQRSDWVDVEHEARRWDLTEERVTELVEQVEEEKELELTLKLKRREQELLEYLRRAHDKEFENARCKWGECGEGPWATWGETRRWWPRCWPTPRSWSIPSRHWRSRSRVSRLTGPIC